MKRNHLVVLAVALACLIAGLLFLLLHGERKEKPNGMAATSASPSPAFNTPGLPATASPAATQQSSVATISPRSKSQKEARAEAVKIVQSVYSAPISFYGKVVDQFGKPVANAKVDYSAVDKFWGPASNYHSQADETGNFSIAGIQGAGLTVGVSKEGYEVIDGKSFQAFAYGMGVDEYRQKPPAQDSPAVFVLRKKAKAEPLVVVSSRQYDLNRNGTSTDISLETARAGAGGSDVLQVSCLTHEESKDARGHFDWTFDVSVPGGGLVERNDETQFAAPEEGYVPQEQIQVNANDPSQRWSSQLQRQYFVKTSDGRYARVSVTAYVGGRTFVVLESYLNPNPSSRNLEYDPHAQ
jgi:hypothetical protein